MFRTVHVALTECQGDCKLFVRQNFKGILTKRIQRGFTAARDHIDARGMRSDKQRVLIARVNCQGPNAHARQVQITRVDALPRHARISRTEDPTAFIARLISIPGEDLIRVTRIDQDTGEIAVRQIASAARPMLATIVRQVKGLFRAHVNV